MASTPNAALWAWRLAHIGAVFIAATFYHLATVLTEIPARPPIIAGYLFGIWFTVLALTGLVVVEAQWVFGAFYYHWANVLFSVAVLIWCVFVIQGHRVLFRGYRSADGIRRAQLRLVFYGGVIGFSGGTSTLLPMFGIYLYPYGDFFIPVYAFIISYAIVRHGLGDIRIVVRRTIVYTTLIALITATYLVMVVVMEKGFQGFLGYRSLFATLAVAFLIAVFFNPLRTRIQTFVDRALFKATTPELAEQRDHLWLEVRKAEQQKAVATLAAGLAHEIKNPLASIKTFTEHLEARFDDPAFRAKFRKIVGGEVERINLIVQQLLNFARPSPPKLTPIQVPRLLDETLELLTNELLQRHVEVSRHYTTTTPILGDPQQLRQAFLNLLLNSLEAMNGSGRLTVETVSQGAELCVTITDNGCGIAPQDLPRLFEPFYTTKPTGTGLGLAVVESILHDHKGRVVIKSRPGQGTQVTLRLPLSA